MNQNQPACVSAGVESTKNYGKSNVSLVTVKSAPNAAVCAMHAVVNDSSALFLTCCYWGRYLEFKANIRTQNNGLVAPSPILTIDSSAPAIDVGDEPEVGAKCFTWCHVNKKAWKAKCKFGDCKGCVECNGRCFRVTVIKLSMSPSNEGGVVIEGYWHELSMYRAFVEY